MRQIFINVQNNRNESSAEEILSTRAVLYLAHFVMVFY